MATKVQREIIAFMKRQYCPVRIITGYKRTVMRDNHPNHSGPIIGCSVNVLDGLKNQKLIIQKPGDNLYVLYPSP